MAVRTRKFHFSNSTWRRLTLKNYRSIQGVTVDLAPFTVVVGPNGSGKSNFADAFVLVRDVGLDASAAIARRGGISSLRRWSRSRPYDVTVDLRLANAQENLDHTYVRHAFTLSSGSEGAWAFKRETIEVVNQGEHALRVERHRKQIETEPRLSLSMPSETASAMVFVKQTELWKRTFPLPWLNLSGVRRYQLVPRLMRQPQEVTENARLDEAGGNLTVALRRLREKEPRRFEDVLLAMRQIIPGLTGISVAEAARHLSLLFTQAQAPAGEAEFSGAEMSEGALRALGIIVAAKQMLQREMLIIEEPEVNIHPGAAQLLFDVLKAASRQGTVLLTTHSPDLLDAARDEEILVCDYRQGTTHIGPLAAAQRELVRDGLFSVAELMRSEPLRIEGVAPAVLKPLQEPP